jgi:hypothetical protein
VNCSEVRARLPYLLYDDLSAEERLLLDQHLAGCAGCEAERAELQHLTACLDATPTPAVHVDVAEVYRRVTERQGRRLRRWRRLALISGIAALLMLSTLFGRNMEVRVESHQVIVSWGTAPRPADHPEPVPSTSTQVSTPKELPPAPSLPAESEERLRLLQALVQALADDATTRDLTHQQEVARLRAEVDDLRRQDFERWSSVERDLRALYGAYVLTRKGNEP